jgi:hypothetical protein
MTTTDFQGGSFDLGRVVQRTFAAIRQNWLVFLISSVVLIGIPSVISGFGEGQNIFMASSPMAVVAILVGGVLTLVGAYVLQGVVVFATINGFNGKPVDLSGALGAGLRFFFPLLGLGILMGLGLFLGFMLLIVPGVILSVMWVVAAPAVVAEKRGIMESFQRSRDLTRGSRWMIFAIIVVYFIIAMILGMVVAGVGFAGAGALATGAAAGRVSIGALILTPIVNVITYILSSAGVASIYYELRTVKEGVCAGPVGLGLRLIRPGPQTSCLSRRLHAHQQPLTPAAPRRAA